MLNTGDLLSSELTAFFHSLNPHVSSVLAGVSGGADSVALLHLLYTYKEKLGISRLAIAHVNHSLRGKESDGDEAFVRELAVSLQIEFFSVTLSPSLPPQNGIEEWARKERYGYFHQIKLKEKFDCIAAAHTADDQAETVIMRIMRGAGLRGLRGALAHRRDGVIRPLLTVQRETIEKWLRERGLSYRTDSSNFDDKFRRNWVRHKIIPLMIEQEKDAVKNIALSASNAASAWEIITEKINIWISSCVIKHNSFSFTVDKRGLSDERLAPEALIELFDEYGITVSRLHLSRVIAAAALSCGEHLLPGGWGFYPCGGSIFFTKRNHLQDDYFCEIKAEGETYCEERGILFRSSVHNGKPEKIIKSDNDNNDVSLSVSEQELPFIFRQAREGERFWPLGAGGQTSFKKFLSKQGISKKQRESCGVVVNSRGRIVWVPGIRVAHESRITEYTEKYIRISCGRLP
ncbi:MAG: tRNA lysidine(34) synthetase TilS [Chitinispirillales bacterium]|jgi:tRNA(Ile)-lysidine synthase|nr:tRNA lysidine(34) synthetase TilS [Chitinispirillales bacterium]